MEAHRRTHDPLTVITPKLVGVRQGRRCVVGVLARDRTRFEIVGESVIGADALLDIIALVVAFAIAADDVGVVSEVADVIDRLARRRLRENLIEHKPRLIARAPSSRLCRSWRAPAQAKPAGIEQKPEKNV
jgi:hypothetical protein